ncbi:MAG: LD-carboxypeptidase [Myxococcota bacterium]|nr:LD-carboxypeptidase [Myxococcota bacterium]
MPALKKARAIAPGARIAVAAPAGGVDRECLEAGVRSLEKLGFEPVLGEGITERLGYLAGTDERRAAELTGFVEDPEIAAIVCARGGYGSARILDRLDPAVFRRARKPLVGYSDITTMLLWQQRRAGLMGIHGPMLERKGGIPAEAGRALVRALTGTGAPVRLEGRSLVPGWAEGRLTGGSLTLVTASLGTPWEVDTRGAILMLEEVSEPPYRIDRQLQQLRAAGKLDAVVGVGLGEMVNCGDERHPEPDLKSILKEILAPLGVPVVSQLPFGHGGTNFCWPVGARAALDGDRGELELLDSAVAAR